MGYYTRFTVEIDGDCDKGKVFERMSEELPDIVGYVIDETGDCIDEAKWYEHDDNMKQFSKLYPKLTFIVSGEGEESPDYWKKYFMNGKKIKKERGYIEYRQI